MPWGRPWERTFLGFRFTRRDLRRCISPEAVKRLKERVREITRRHPGQANRARCPGAAPVSTRVEGLLWVRGGPFHLQGMGLVDSEAPSRLSVEAMGAARVQGAAEHAGSVGTWRGTRQSRPTVHGASAGVRLWPWPCRAAISMVWECRGCTSRDHLTRTAVVRDPYARWCGRGEAVRPLPIPIRRHLDSGSFRKLSSPLARGGLFFRGS